MAKYYAVRQGRVPGIYRSWPDCQDQVRGFKGAQFKSFKTEEEAQAYLVGGPEASLDREALTQAPDPDTLVAYVDGSYRQEDASYSFGVYCLFGDGDQAEWSGRFHKDEASSMRNVAGEIYGAMEAMKFAQKKGMSKLILHYDYVGICHWALGDWKRNKVQTQAYHDFYQSIKDQVQVDFVKVEAHTGVAGNEKADQLAKEADFILPDQD